MEPTAPSGTTAPASPVDSPMSAPVQTPPPTTPSPAAPSMPPQPATPPVTPTFTPPQPAPAAPETTGGAVNLGNTPTSPNANSGISTGKWLLIGIAIGLTVLILGTAAFYVMTQNQAKPTPTPVVNTPKPTPPKPAAPTVSQVPQNVNQIPLTITTPLNNSTVAAATVKITGLTSPGAEVSANEIEGKADSKGQFSLNFKLNEGENPILITAVDAQGNSSETEINVTYEVPE